MDGGADRSPQRIFLRSKAVSALERIGPAAEAAVPALNEALQDDDSGVRSKAASALGRIGPAAKAAVPALIEALQDDDYWVRSKAALALEKIRTKTP